MRLVLKKWNLMRWVEQTNTTDDKAFVNFEVTVSSLQASQCQQCRVIHYSETTDFFRYHTRFRQDMRFFRLVLVILLSGHLFLGIAMAVEHEQAAVGGGGALRGPTRLHRVAPTAEDEVDERCQIPTTDKPLCVASKKALLQKIADDDVDVILICLGATIDLTPLPFGDPSIPINSNKRIICEGFDGGCFMTSQSSLSLGNANDYFLIEQTDVHVSFCGISFSHFLAGVIDNAAGVLFISHCTFLASTLTIGKFSFDDPPNVLASLEMKDSTFSTGDITWYTIIRTYSSTIAISNCRFTKGAGPYLSLSSSSANIVQSDFVNNFSFNSPVVTLDTGSSLTLERCTFQQNLSIIPRTGAIYLSSDVDTTSSKLILEGDENQFISNGSIEDGKKDDGTHILVGPGGEVTGCESTTFINPSQMEGVIDFEGEPVSC